MKDIFLKLMFNILKNCLNLITIYNFTWKNENWKKNYVKTEYVTQIRNLKQALKKAGTLKKVHSVIKFNQNAWLKAYIDINNDVRKKSKSDFEKD